MLRILKSLENPIKRVFERPKLRFYLNNNEATDKLKLKFNQK